MSLLYMSENLDATAFPKGHVLILWLFECNLKFTNSKAVANVTFGNQSVTGHSQTGVVILLSFGSFEIVKEAFKRDTLV